MRIRARLCLYWLVKVAVSFTWRKKIGNLDGVYAQVIEDLGKVYSLGYKPTNEKRDNTWHSVKIELRKQPDITTRAGPGYYAK